jgi:proteasome lid subunit RPN8/RPN11
MRVFGLELTPAIIEAIAAHAEADYPSEACGLVLGRAGAETLARVVPMRNVQDHDHDLDPVSFPRDARDAFRIDDLERLRVLERADAEGLVERVVYHSHCDAGAYFSPEDRAMALQDGVELLPGVVHVVVSVRQGRRSDLAAFRFVDGRVEEHRLPFAAPAASPEALPDLALRAMEARESDRPVRPVGGVLLLRKLARHEVAELAPLAEGRSIRLDAAQADEVQAFARGLLSPLTGYLRAAEARSVELLGRLPSGTPWRAPVELWVPGAALDAPLFGGEVARLVGPGGASLGLMAVAEARPGEGDGCSLAGPLFVDPEVCTDPDAAELRASLVRRGARRVLAVPPELAGHLPDVDLGAFDVVLTTAPVAEVRTERLWWTSRSPWLGAAMAQNQGATHLWVTEPGLRRAIEGSLELEPWQPGAHR